MIIVLTGTVAFSDAIAGPEDPEDGGQWGPVLTWPHIAVSAANLPNGKVITWSGAERDTWPRPERTYSAVWDPVTGIHQEILYQGHNMFSAHMAMLEDGQVFVNGGRNTTNSPWLSFFNYQNNTWTPKQNMLSGGRWYPTTLMLSDGKMFTAIGTSSLPRNPEMYDPNTDSWQIKNGIDFDDMVLDDYFYSGTHGESRWWPLLHLAPNGLIFHSGPTPKMHYIDPAGNGSYTQVGPAFTNWYHKHGVTIMYDEGKLLTAGGWISGSNSGSVKRVFTVDLNGPSPVVTVQPTDNGNPTFTKSMHFARKYHSSMMAPTGEVYVTGGNGCGQKFSDCSSALAVEIWDPVNERWRVGAAMSVPRNYHSTGILLTDGRMLTAGGGYCSNSTPACDAANHRDGQVYTPPYLFNSNGNLAPRPSISVGPGFISSGQIFNVQATAGMQKFSLIKMGSISHGVNTDVRFLNVQFTEVSAGSYNLTPSANPNVLTPGYWMLFALNSNGVPSVAHVLRANSSSGGLPWINTPPSQITPIGGNGNLQLTAGDGDGDPLTYSATGLPPGLNINASTGLISGATTALGTYQVMVTVSDFDEGTASANFQWTVYDPGGGCSDCLDFNIVTTSSYSNQDKQSNVSVEDGGATLVLTDNTWRQTNQTFSVTADTILEFDFQSDGQGEIHGIGFDENGDTFDADRIFQLFGTQNWGGAIHDFDNYSVIGSQIHYYIPVGLSYTGGTMRLVFTNDHDAGSGSNSRFSNVRIHNGVPVNTPPTISNPGDQATVLNGGVSLAITASDADGDTLSYSASGLPSGLAIDAASGVIAGSATPAGSFAVTVTVDDGTDSASVSFSWDINTLPNVTSPGPQADLVGSFVSVPIVATDDDGDTLSYSATGLQSDLTIDPGTGVISGTPSTESSSTVTVTVDDGTDSVSVSFSWDITIPNVPPNVTNPGAQLDEPLSSVSLQIVASDAEPLSYSATDLPPGLTINSASGLISGSPNTTGSYAVTVTVSDGTFDVPVSFSWDINMPPSVTNPGPQDDLPGSIVSLSIVATDVEPLSYSAVGLPPDLTIDAGSGLISGTANTAGSFAVTVTVSDGTYNVPVSFSWDINTAPTVTNPGAQLDKTDSSVILLIVATDADGDTLNYTASGLPANLAIDAGSGFISGPATTIGNFNVTVTVDDGNGGSVSVSFDWTVYDELAYLVEPIPGQEGLPVNIAVIPNSLFPDLIFTWNFGDGTGDFVDIGPSVSHTFAEKQIYAVTVKVEVPATSVNKTYSIFQLIHGLLTANKPSIGTSIAVHPVQAQVWNVNPDNDSVTVIDTNANTVIVEIPVGERPSSVAFAPDSTAWVVNKGSATISVIDSASFTIVDTVVLDNASQPHGLAFSPTAAQAYVALEALGDIIQIDAVSRTESGRVYVGPNPRHLSIVADGSLAYVSRFVTPRLMNEFTDYPIVGLGAANEPIGLAEIQTGIPPVAQYFGGEVLEVDLASLTVQKTIILRWSNDLVSESSGPGLPNYLGPPVISPDDSGIWIPSKQDNILAGVLRGGQGMTFDQTVRAVTSKIDRTTSDEDIVARIDHDNASVANYAAFGLYGTHLYTTLEGNREVAISNAYTGIEIYRFDVGSAPQGVTMSPDGNTLYVNNFMDRTVGIYDISEITQRNNLVVNEIVTLPTVSTESLSPSVFIGKQLFYDARDPRLSAGPYMSCASCHADGGSDNRIWDFTGVGEGLRNTITLKGRAGMGHGFLHWSANFDEVQDFEAQIRFVAGGTGLMSDTDFFSGTRSQPLGDLKAGFSSDLDALADYVGSLNRVPDSPYRNADGTLSAQAEVGKQVFEAMTCADCHTPTSYTDSSLPTVNLHDVGTLTTNSGSRSGGVLNGIDTPTLLGVWQTAPYLHDGSALDLTEAIAAHTGITLSAQELDDLAFYLQELDDVTGNACPDCLDFNIVTTSSYSNQDKQANVSVADDGATLVLLDNTWRRTDQTFIITADAMLEFDFQSNSQGEVHGIGFDEDNSLNATRMFQLYGTQNWGGANHDFDNYVGGGSVAQYQIPVGLYYQGSAMNLVFVNDNDAGSGNDSRFSNVRIIYGLGGNLQPTISNPGNQTTELNSSVTLTVVATDPNPGDILSFSDVGLPAGLALNSSTGEITGIATTLGTSSVTITVDDGNGGSDSASFDWFVCDPAVDCSLNFNIVTTSSYSNQDRSVNFSVADAGATLVLADNTWRQTDQTFVITVNTVIEFDFQSDVEGEIQGIGFDEDADTFNADRIFKLYGTQNWGILDYETYPGDGSQVHYLIPVGLYYQGSAMRLVFANDDDGGAGSNSRFSNIRIYEAAP